MQGMHHNCRDCALHTPKHRSHRRHLAIRDIDPTERNQNKQRRQHKQTARNQCTWRAMHQPADVSGQLLRLGPGQKHAVVERMVKARLRDPAPLIHQLFLQNSNLPRWPAKADEAKLEPEKQRLREGDLRRGICHVWRLHFAWHGKAAARHKAISPGVSTPSWPPWIPPASANALKPNARRQLHASALTLWP